ALAPAVGFIDNRLQLFDRKRGLRNQISLVIDPRTMRHIDLDPVSAIVELFARGFTSLDWTVDELCAFRNSNFRGIAFERISTGCRDRARSDKHSRAGNV